ncbi:AAA family ATPase [Peribacillus asahii]|uniref:AAA family ATPase n=1 Tax=Peribacillus asahii TaxID=228899 RepID=UPI00380A921E
MKPLKLTMQAFGPYANCETIDFTELANRTMFVISGKTGAGKTTIFDGISFAIYGKASGEDRNGADLRSQFAEEHMITSVSLEFRLRGKTYFIQRSPQQERKKKSGEGTTTIGAKAELYELSVDGDKKLLGANVREVDENIKHIIGIDANQFRQILMIPQGEFRKLLTSESKEKEQILQKLFHTEQYKRIEEKLKEDALFLKRECEKNLQARMDLLKSIIVSDNEELQTAIAAAEPNEQLILPLLADEIAASIQQRDAYNRQLKGKQESRDLLHQEITKAEQVLQLFAEKEKRHHEKEELAAKRTQIEEWKESLKRAQKASLLEKQEQYYLRVGREKQNNEEELKKLAVQADHLAVQHQQLAQVYESELSKAGEREEAMRAVHQLQQLRESVFSFVQLQTDVQQSEEKWKQSIVKREAAEQTLVEKERLVEQILQTKADAEQATLLYAEREREAEKNEALLTKLNKLSDSLLVLENAEQQKNEQLQQLRNKMELHAQEQQRFAELEEKWRASQAGLLARTLQTGHACPVCGAEDHPNPAHLLEEMPSEADMKQQKQRLTEREEQKRKKESEFFQAESQFNSLQKRVQEQEEELIEIVPTFERNKLSFYQHDYHEQAARLRLELTHLLQKKQALKHLEAQLLQVKEEVQDLKAGLIQWKEIEDQAKTAYIEQKTKLTGLTESLPEQIRTKQAYLLTLNEAIATQKKLQDAFEHVQMALQKAKEQESAIRTEKEIVEKKVTSLQRELDEERTKFSADMTKQGFATYKEYGAAKRTESEIEWMEKEIQQYEQQWQTITSLYHDVELKLMGVTRPDLISLQATFKRLNEELELLRHQQNEVTVAQQKNEQIQATLMEMKEQQQEMEERYSIVGHLYEMARGQNPFRITFERYVLAAFLDDILKEANTRLLKMTSGRYQLLRKLDPARRNIQSGLELSVYDQYTSQERHVKTLSGGESFKAALALALGLADVVQNHAGGISLETMFIDEGFGTLDPESLDQAIEALMDIQSSGRLVGIISHVPELKERIDAQLEVMATQKGSRTAFCFSS